MRPVPEGLPGGHALPGWKGDIKGINGVRLGLIRCEFEIYTVNGASINYDKIELLLLRLYRVNCGPKGYL
jgi:hypothetical protein